MTPDAEGTTDADRAAGRAAGTILVVDDEGPVRDVLRAMLEDAGYGVITAGEGASALAAVRGRTGALRAVILDATLPGMAVDEVVRALEALAPGAPILIASGWSAADVRARHPSLAGRTHLQKPFRLQQLLETLRQAIEGP